MKLVVKAKTCIYATPHQYAEPKSKLLKKEKNISWRNLCQSRQNHAMMKTIIYILHTVVFLYRWLHCFTIQSTDSTCAILCSMYEFTESKQSLSVRLNFAQAYFNSLKYRPRKTIPCVLWHIRHPINEARQIFDHVFMWLSHYFIDTFPHNPSQRDRTLLATNKRKVTYLFRWRPTYIWLGTNKVKIIFFHWSNTAGHRRGEGDISVWVDEDRHIHDWALTRWKSYFFSMIKDRWAPTRQRRHIHSSKWRPMYIWLGTDEAKVILFINISNLHPTWRWCCYD
jgi:hypothetical protein